MSLRGKLKTNINHRLIKSRLIPNDDCTNLWPCYKCAQIYRKADRPDEMLAYTHMHAFAYAPIQIIHCTQETVETFPNLFAAACCVMMYSAF